MSTLPVVTAAAFPDQFSPFQLVDKVGMLVRGLRLVASDLSWLLVNAAVYGGTRPRRAAGHNGPAGARPLAAAHHAAAQAGAARTSAPPASAVQTLYDVIAGVGDGTLASDAAAQAALQTITGWPLPTSRPSPRRWTWLPVELPQPASYDAARAREHECRR